MGFLAWHFNIVDARGETVATVNRAFRGFGREVSELSSRSCELPVDSNMRDVSYLLIQVRLLDYLKNHHFTF